MKSKRNSKNAKRSSTKSRGYERDYKGRETRDSRQDDRDARNTRYDAQNDVSWYTRYPNLSVASAQFPFPYRPGMSINLGTTEKELSYTIPGVMSLQWYPSIGWSENATDPASIVCKELYQRVRKAYGAGDLLSDAPDFMIYLMALDGIFSYLATLRRVYRVLTAWTPDNYMLPDRLLNALGLNDATIQSLRINRNQLWQVINELTLMSRKFTCPAVMDIMNRHFWMNDNVYTDTASINSQMYVFRQMGYYQYAEQNMPSGDPAGGLKMVATPFAGTATQTPETLFTYGRDLIDALVAWDDAYTINGYLSRAFEGTPNFIVDEIPADQPFNPVYEPEVLQQIENSRPIWAGTINIASLNVSQDVLTNAIIHKPTVKLFTTTTDNQMTNVANAGMLWLAPYLSMRSDAPTVADNIIASRLHSNVKPIKGDDVNARIIAATEIPVAWNLYGAGTGNVGSIISPVIACGTEPSTQTFLALRYNMSMPAFDWSPMGLFVSYSSSTPGVDSNMSGVYVFGDVHNITTLTVDNLLNMHKICVYSEFNAFSVG